ncbi:MAG: hypothetical protein HY981_00595 [Candidatus Magasanikbacteria bacterium]|nr:hypothetical protein [Candidatus Magasanikbacteria bacterium]
MPQEFKTKLKEKKQLTPDTWALTFDLGAQTLVFQMGQFVMLKILLHEKKGFMVNEEKKQLQYRSYSIASSAAEKNFIELIVKKTADGFVSRYLTEIMDIGNELSIMGPYGNFILPENPPYESIIFIAAGSGVAPCLCMMRTINTRALPIYLHLLFSNKTEADIIARKEIESLCADNLLLSYDFTLTRADDSWQGLKGRIHSEMLTPRLSNKKRTAFYLCGVPAMVNEANALLENMGVSPNDIKQEIYN